MLEVWLLLLFFFNKQRDMTIKPRYFSFFFAYSTLSIIDSKTIELDPLIGCKIEGDGIYVGFGCHYIIRNTTGFWFNRKKKLSMLTKLVFWYIYWIRCWCDIREMKLGTLLKMIQKFRDQNKKEKNVGTKIKTTQNIRTKNIFLPTFYISRRDSNWCNRIQIL